ncbi:ABC transporter ATP-binding protein [Alkalibacterium olivapovliticus]|uniref:ABC-type quaternary amine transporter n=1 Tax=Alkalibacterium olivapovliticus TaxID=99907 RepID=A0A2T0W8E1_9LACT|nr:ABC transporter ATP-binding protein [Alkalibacterium olivapovliticus]PRY82973.1 iron(III) transport system ATP-binding protein [Alkalibacterium olivapovliticus]
MIEIKGLQVKYDDFIAIDDVNLTIKEGEFFTLLGPSGCGKTTTLRSIAGFLKPSEGSINVNGKNIVNTPIEKRGLGMIFQSYALFPTMSVFDNIAYGLKIEKKSKAQIEDRVYELADLVELNEEQLGKNVSDLSGGQQQRVAIARALAKKPTIVLFDEPLSNLDAKLRKQLRLELKRIQRETGMTAIYVTHDQDEALEISDHIAVFNNGKIEQIGTPREIYDHSASEFVCKFIGEANYLGPSLITHINEHMETNRFNPNAKHYVREEKVNLMVPEGSKAVPVKGNILQEVFYGTFSTYICEVLDTTLRIIVKEDGTTRIDSKNELTLYIDPKDILEYGGD